MASVPDIKRAVSDLHDLALRLGLTRPGGTGNYHSPTHKDKTPSLSIYQRDGAQAWKDWSTGEGGDCFELVRYTLSLEFLEAKHWLEDAYGLPRDEPKAAEPARPKTRAEWVAEQCLANDIAPAVEYLEGRGIAPDAVRHSFQRRTLGFNTWESSKVEAGQPGHGGPGVAFICRTLNPGHVAAVDVRYLDPALNGGVKSQTQGDKLGAGWYADLQRLQRAETVYLVESAINALTVETCDLRRTAAYAILGTGNAEHLDCRWLVGKRVVLCLDWDEPLERGPRAGYGPGQMAAWTLYDRLTALDVAVHRVDQGDWEWNDINDVLQDLGPEETRSLLKRLDYHVIPGVRGDAKHKGKSRLWLPAHDSNQYWRFRAKEDFVSYVKSRKEDPDTGETRDEFEDLCGFRLAGITRVTVAGAVSVLSGEEDNQPATVFAVSAQVPRHGNRLLRRVVEEERLYKMDHWAKIGPVFNPGPFQRMLTILERSADLGARHAVNFVGLCWSDGKPVVNEGPDCYFKDPHKQCPYHNLTFPGGTARDARTVVQAYQATFGHNAAAQLLAWALGGHLKAFLGWWPHMTLQADKGAGKSTLVKALERTISFTMFSGQSLQSEFRLLTSTSHTSHPVGWEEISARRQDIIDKAVSLLQESYQYTITRRGSEMLEYVVCAPVLLAGEDVPVRPLEGKLVRADLSGRKGPMLPRDLPRFPVLQWLQFLAGYSREQIAAVYDQRLADCQRHARSPASDEGARRMAGNYAAVATAWTLLCEFLELPVTQGDFVLDLYTAMNDHITETDADREPWVWIMELFLSELSAGQVRHAATFEVLDGVPCLLVRTSSVMDHLAHSHHLRERWNALSVKTDRVFKRQAGAAGVLLRDHEGKPVHVERTIDGRRWSNLVAFQLPQLEVYGLHATPPRDIPAGSLAEPAELAI